MTDLDLQEQIARIQQAQSNIQCGQAETEKFVVEQRKRIAEAGKFNRERTTMVLTAGAALAGAGAVLGGLVVKLFGG